MKRFLLSSLVLFVVFSLTAQPQSGFGGLQIPAVSLPTSQTWKDVNYADDDQAYHTCDIYLPQTVQTSYPVVIHIYGSAWFSNNSKGAADLGTIVKSLLEAGFAVVCPNHRSSTDAKWPAQIHDIKAVVRFVRGEAEKYKFDTSFIASSGFSSGGHLASVAATTSGTKQTTVGNLQIDLEGSIGNYLDQSSAVNAACDWSGPIDLTAMDCGEHMQMGVDSPSPEDVLLGSKLSEEPDKYLSLSATTYIDPNDPPVIIFHGEKDNVVPCCQGRKFYESLQAAGVRTEATFVPDGGHGVGMYDEANLQKMILFLRQTMNGPAPSVAAPADSVKANKADRPERKKEESEYEKLMKKGGAVQEGLFRVRHIDDKYYFEVPDSMLGRLILCVTRFTAVPQGFGKFAGEEIDHSAIYLEQRDTTQILLRQYVLSHLADSTDNISRTLEQSTVDPIVMAFRVIGRDKESGDCLIDVTPLFKMENNLTSLSNTDKTAMKLGALLADRTFIDTLKVFPTNIEAVCTRTYGAQPTASPASKTGSVTVGTNTSMVILPRTPMRKRLWDERVGYFVNNYTRFSDTQHKTEHESFISRYQLVPKDKNKYLRGELTEPVTPIVYYIDPATPKKWIPYLIKGVNDWNVAFETAGFKNAIVAKEWPTDRPDMSLDDARFSVIRYLPSETENAYGPRIVDPRSGQIIEAHVCWYHNVMNLLTKWYMVQCGPLDKRAQNMKFDDRLMGELIRFVSSHEVGHTLGLRHNMGASFATPVEKLRDKQWVEQHGHTVSIMDYARFNYVAQPEDKISEKGLFPRIGEYDKWAIKWGYQWRPEFKDEYVEKEKLMTETTKTLKGNPRLWFGGEGRNDDARAQTEDLSDNSVKASEYGLRNLQRVMQNLPQWTKEDNDQYDDLREMYKAVYDQYNRYLNHVVKNIGSRYANNMPGTEPVEYVSVERQREAVDYVGRQLFDAPEWLYPAAILSKTGTNAFSTQQTMQQTVMTRLLSAATLASVGNTQYSVEEYLNDLFRQVWQPVDGVSDFKAKSRRQLQRAYLQSLNALLNPSEAELKTPAARYYNTDATLYALQNLGKVEQFCQQQRQSSDGLNALHYDDLLREVKLIRDRRTTVK